MTIEYKDTFLIIGENVKKYRRQRRLTQEQLADKIPKMDRSKISDIENGKENFTFSKLLQICEALEIDLELVVKKPRKKKSKKDAAENKED